jgi:tyrosinase
MVRYPLSGLVGTQQDRDYTELHNSQLGPVATTNELNKNLQEWMLGTVQIDIPGKRTRVLPIPTQY